MEDNKRYRAGFELSSFK